MEEMIAAVRRSYCEPEQIVLETVPVPELHSNEVLIKVHATTVNRTDCANLTARPFIMRFVLGMFKPKQHILGTDFSGEIVAIGEAVQSFKVGERVFGFQDLGAASQAEFVKVKETEVYRIPEALDYQQAVASLEGAHYAYTFIHKVRVAPGERVLINGATGGIGSALIQFVQEKGAWIAATCDTMNMERITALGADRIIDYTQEDFTMMGEKFDYVFDAVGKSTYGACRSILKENGVYISSELGPYAQNLYFAATSAFRKKKVIFPAPYAKEKTIPYILARVEDESFTAIIDRTYAFADIADAYRYVIEGKKTGNVVITI